MEEKKTGPEENRKKRILLVYANPYYQPLLSPYGLATLEAQLKDAYDVTILSPYLFPDPEACIRQTLETFQPDAVGINLRNIDTCVPEVDFTKPEPLLKSVFFPDIVREGVGILSGHMGRRDRVFLGGTAFSVGPESMLDYFSLDFGITGRAEAVFPPMLDTLFAGGDILDTPGLVYRKEDGGFARNPEAPFDFEGLSKTYPDRDALYRFSYHIRGVPIHTKVGCDQDCIYCVESQIEGRRYIYRPPEDVAGEIRAVTEADPTISTFFFTDCEMNLPDGRHMLAVCDAILKSPAAGRIFWTTHLNPVPLTGAMTRKMARAGCNSVVLTIDSASDRVLKKSGKDFRFKDIGRAFEACRKAGLTITADLIFGLPGENDETVEETVRMIKQNPDVLFEFGIGARIYRGTPLSRLAAKCDRRFLFGALEKDFFEPAFYSSPCSPVAFQERLAKILKGCKNIPESVHSLPTAEEKRAAHTRSLCACHALGGDKEKTLEYYRAYLETGDADISLLECLTAIYGSREDFDFLIELYGEMLPRMMKDTHIPASIRIVYHRNLAAFCQAAGLKDRAGYHARIARFLEIHR
jgi:hypothetical protein